MALLRQSTSNLMASLLGSLPQGERMGFAGTLAAGLQAGNQASHNQQVMSNARRDALQRSRELELELLKYQADTLAGATAQAKKEKEAAQLRGQIRPELQELYDVDPERAIAQSFPDPISPYQQATLDQGAQTENRLERAFGHTVRQDDRTSDRLEADLQRNMAQDEFTGTLQGEAAKRDQTRLEMEQAKAEQPDKFTQDVQRILAANPELAKSEDGIRRAMNYALGTIQTNTDPVQGGTMTTNVATSQGQPVQLPPQAVQRLPVPTDAQGQQVPPISIDDMAGEIGAWAWAEDVVGKTVGQVNPAVVDEARVRAATQIDFLKQKALVALSSSARPLASESKRIEALFPSKGIYDSAARAKAQMNHLRNMAVKTHNDYADMIEAGELPHEQRAELRQKQFEIRSFIDLLPTEQEFSAPSANPGQGGTGGTGAGSTTPDQITDPDPLGLR